MLLSEAVNQDYERVLTEVREVQDILKQRARVVMDEVESGRSTTPDVEVNVGFKPKSYDDPANSLLFLGLARECIIEEKFSILDLNQGVASRFNLRQYATGQQKRTLKGRKGTHNRKHGNIAVTKMPEDSVSDLREKYPVLKPVFDQLVYKNGGLASVISHELTHAYIHRNTGSVSGQRSAKIGEIDEAAAQLTGELMGKSGSDPLEYENIDREKLHLVEKLLNDKAREADNLDQKIDIVRRESAKAAKRVQKHPSFDIIQALDPERVEFAKRFSRTVREMQGVEKESIQVLEALGIMEGDLQGEQREKYYITQLENNLDEVVENIFPTDTGTTASEAVDKLIEGEASMESISLSSNNFSEDSGGPNESLQSLSNAADQLENIASGDDLQAEEARQLEKSLEKIRRMLDAFQEKRDRIKQQYEAPQDVFNYRSKTSQKLLPPTEACQKMELYLKKYLKMIDAGLKLCDIGIEGLEQLHDSEARSAELMKKYGESSEYREIQEAEEKTEEAYTRLKKSRKVLRNSKNNIETVKEDLENAEEVLNS